MLVWAFAVVGLVLRLAAFLHADPLFVDEAMLAHSIATRSWAELTPPFSYQQVAPPGLLWIAKASTALFGMSPHALRLGPFLASAVTIVTFALTARRWLGQFPAAVAMALVALSPVFLRYSDEFKQYGFDVMGASLLLWLTTRMLDDPTVRNRAAWVAGGAVVALTSTAAPLVLGGAFAGAWLSGLTAVRWRALPAAAGAWGLAIGLAFVGYYNPAETPYLRRFWSGNFLDPLQPGFLDRVFDAATVAEAIALRPPIPFPSLLAVALVVLIGLPFWLARPRRPMAGALYLPIVLGGIASMLHRYPIAQRTGLFALPAIAVLAGGAVALVTDPARRPWLRAAGIAAGLAAVLGSTMALVRWFRVLPSGTGLGEVATRLRTEPSRPVYLESRGVPEFLFYTTDWRNPDRDRLIRFARIADSIGPNSGNNPPRPHPVTTEGDHLRFDDGGRTLLLGIPTGMEVIGTGVVRPSVPDTGWAENEARRIETLGDALVVLVRSRRAANLALVAALRSRGASVDTAYADPAAQLLTLHWPHAAPVDESHP